MIVLAPVVRELVIPLCRLKVAEDQTRRVAPNAVTLAEAAYEPGTHVWAVRAGGDLVGLVGVIDPRDEILDRGREPIAEGSAHLWRLMIGAEHQGRGFGAAALRAAEGIARDWGFEALSLTAVPGETGAIPFYRRHGYAETGRVIEGEVELIRRFAP